MHEREVARILRAFARSAASVPVEGEEAARARVAAALASLDHESRPCRSWLDALLERPLPFAMAGGYALCASAAVFAPRLYGAIASAFGR